MLKLIIYLQNLLNDLQGQISRWHPPSSDSSLFNIHLYHNNLALSQNANQCSISGVGWRTIIANGLLDEYEAIYICRGRVHIALKQMACWTSMWPYVGAVFTLPIRQ